MILHRSEFPLPDERTPDPAGFHDAVGIRPTADTHVL